MATFKHISSKNADYGAAEQYLTFEHDEFTMKPTLDENGRLMLREDYRIATLNCGDEDFAVACMRSNLRYGKNQKREDVKSHHYIISFDPRDAVDNGLTVDRAQALGEEFCRKQFPGHQAIVCTHPDGHNHSGNIHVHIVINSLRIEEVPFLPYMDRPADTRTGCKHRCTDAAMEYFKAEVMELCHRENLYQIDLLHGSKNRITEREYWAQRKGQAKIAVDALIPQVSSFEELLTRLQAAGYEIKPGKYVSCRAPGQERFTRLKTLGADYTEEAIRERIAGRRAKAAKAPREQRDVSLLIDIENSIKAAQSKGYEQWAKIHNLKQAAKTMNFLTEHKIEQYADLVSRIEEMAAESGQAADALKDAEKRLADMAVLIKNVSTYQKTKPVYDAYRKARNREKYRAGQEQAIILHEAAARSLKAAGIAKLPNLAALQSEYEALQAQKEALYADYGKLKKKVREYDIIKQNIDSILQADRQPEREKGTERG